MTWHARRAANSAGDPTCYAVFSGALCTVICGGAMSRSLAISSARLAPSRLAPEPAFVSVGLAAGTPKPRKR